MTVGVADDPAPGAVLTLYGAGLLGAAVTFGSADLEDAPRTLVVPADRPADRDVDPRARVVVYRGEPPTPDVAQFERDVWSETPTRPPDAVHPERPLLRGGDTTLTHRGVLAAAREVAESVDLGPDDEVAVRGSLGHPGVVTGVSSCRCSPARLSCSRTTGPARSGWDRTPPIGYLIAAGVMVVLLPVCRSSR